LALTDECSVAGVVRAHVEALKHNLHLIIGSTFRVQPQAGKPPLQLILLAQNREGYGNLCELITWARTRAPKGSYLLNTTDISAPCAELTSLQNVPHCLAILAPAYGMPSELILEQARWLHDVFDARAHLGLTLLHDCRDDQHQSALDEAAKATALPIVALGHVQMHKRLRKLLHDTLTAISTHRRVADCGYESAPTPNNICERAYVWPRFTRRTPWRELYRLPTAAPSAWRNYATNTPTKSCPKDTRLAAICVRKLIAAPNDGSEKCYPNPCAPNSKKNWL
jgi:DNA polymerase III alpha subunit